MNSDKPNTAEFIKSAHLVTDAQGVVRNASGAFEELFQYRLPPSVQDKHLKELFPAQVASELVHLVYAAQQSDGMVVATIRHPSEQSHGLTCRAAMLPGILPGGRLVLLQFDRSNAAGGAESYDTKMLFSATRHDVNNPLTAIIGFSELLKLEENPNKRTKFANLIASEADRCRRALEKAEYFVLEPKPNFRQLDVNEIVRSVVESRRLPLELEGIDCDLSLDPSIPAIFADSNQMEFVIYTILLNAEQSLLGQTQNKQIRIRTAHHKDGVVVEIQDTGKGIQPTDLERIFRPFQSSKRRGGGLGLAIANRIITNHDGSIELQSAVQEGTTARIVLKHRAHKARDVHSGANRTIGGKRILIVEPRREIVSLYCELLTLEGATPFGATTIQHAVQVLEEEPIDILVIDESISAKDSKRVAAAVSLQPKPAPPIFVGIVENIQAMGCQQWLREWGAHGTEKPLTPHALAQFLPE